MDLYKQWVAAREEAGFDSDRSFCEAAGVVKDKITRLFNSNPAGGGVDTMMRMLAAFNRGRAQHDLPHMTDEQFRAMFPRWAPREEVTMSGTRT